MNSFKKNVKDHYEKIELSQDQLASLQRKMDKGSVSKIRRNFILGGFLAIAATWFLIILLPSLGKSSQELIVAEVTKNHLKNMPVEIDTHNLSQVSEFLNQLDFAMIDSKHTKSLNLLGGRYCSILGTTAAQLQYQDNQGRYYTVYQVPLPEEFRDKRGLLFDVLYNGVKVEGFSDKGLLVVRASSETR